MAEKEQKSNIVGFDGNAIGGIASAAGGVISTGLNAFFTSRENRKNREWTEQQNNLAWQRQRQLIDEQRAYDTPKAQMQRLMQAGLNPNLIYGGVDQSPMAAQTAPNAAGKYAGVAPQVDPYVASEISKNMAEIRRMDAQTGNDTRLTDAKIKEIYGETPVSKANISYLQASADAASANARRTNQSLQNLTAEFEKLTEEKREIALRNSFTERTFETNVKRLEALYDIDRATADNIQRTIDATIKEMLASASNSYAQADLARSQIKLNDKEAQLKDALIGYYGAVKNNQDANTAYVKVQCALEKAFGPAMRAGDILKATQLTIYDNNGVLETVNKVSDRKAIEKAYAPKWE